MPRSRFCAIHIAFPEYGSANSSTHPSDCFCLLHTGSDFFTPILWWPSMPFAARADDLIG
jgi:hypothetical protein